jgi:hypothetical protein
MPSLGSLIAKVSLDYADFEMGADRSSQAALKMGNDIERAVTKALGTYKKSVGDMSAANDDLGASMSRASAGAAALAESEDQASARISDMVARSLEAQSAMEGVGSASQNAASGMAAVGASADQVRGNIQSQTQAMRDAMAATTLMNDETQALRASLAQGGASFEAITEQYSRLDRAMATGKLSMDDYNTALAAIGKQEDARTVSLNSLTAKYDPLSAATRKLAADQAFLEDAFKTGAISSADYERALAGIKTDQALVGLQQLAQEEAQLERAFKSGELSSVEYKKALADIGTNRTALNDIAGSADKSGKAMEGFGLKTAGARTEVLRLVNDLANGNFGRLDQSATVLAERMDLMGVMASGAGLAIAAIAAPLVLAGVAMVMVANQNSAMNDALVLTGNYAGTTADGLRSMAQAATAGGATFNVAAEAVTQLAATGKLTGEEISSLGQTTADVATYTSMSVKQMVDEFTKLADDPVKASVALNDQYHYLTVSTYDQITALEKQGDATGAAQVAVEAFSSAMDGRTQDIAKNEGTILAGWRDIKAMINGAIEAVGSFGTTASPEKTVQFWQSNKQTANAGIGPAWTPEDEADLQKAITVRDATVKAAADKARVDRQNQETIDAKHSYETWNTQFATPAEKRAKDIQTYIDTIATPLNISPEQQISDEQKISDKYPDKKAKTAKTGNADATNDRAVAQIQAEIEAKQQQLTLLNQYGLAQDKISDGDKKVLQIESQLGLVQQDRIGKVSDAQLKVQLGYAQELAAVEKQIAAATRAAQAQKDYSAQIDKWSLSEQSMQAALDQDLALYGTTGEARKLMTTQLQYEAQARDTIAKALRDGHPLSEQQQKDLISEADARAKVVGSLQAQRDALAAATQLQTENEKFAANSILDEKDRAAAILAIDAKKWQDLIANAGDGTEAQKKLIEQYDQWYADEQNKPVIDQWKKTVGQIDSDFHNGFLQMLENGKSGWESFTQSLKNTFETTVVDMLYQTFAKKYVIQLVADVAGVISGPGVEAALLGQSSGTGGGSSTAASGLQAASGVKSVLGYLQTGYNYLAGSLASATAAYSGLMGAGAIGASAFGGVATTGAAAASAAEAASMGSSAALSGIYGSTVASTAGTAATFGGVAASSGTGAAGAAGTFTAGSTAGLSAIPIAGWIAAGMLEANNLFKSGWNANSGDISTAGQVLGSGILTLNKGLQAIGLSSTFANIISGASTIDRLFGHKAPTVQSTGVTGTATAAGFQGQDYEDWKAEGGWFTSDKTGTNYGALTSDQSTALNTTIASTVAAVKALDTASGGEGIDDTGINSFSVTMKDDWSTTANATTSLNNLSDSIIGQVIPGIVAFQNSGEALTDTVTRLGGVFQGTDALAADIGVSVTKAFGAVGLAGAQVRLDLVAAAGGIDNFNSEVSAYYSTYYSQSEQLANVQTQMQAAFASLNLTMPTSNDGFRALVSSLDLTTSAGQNTFAALMALAPGFAQMTAAAAQAASNQQTLWDNYFSSIYTTQQTQAQAAQNLQGQFTALGVSMPQTNADFQALVENMDTTSPSAKLLQNELLALAPAFSQVTASAAQAQQAADQAAQATQSLWNGYFSAIYTSSDQAAMSARQLQDQFNALGVAMPKTNADFQTLVENMDTSSPAVLALQNELLALAPAFAQVTASAASAQATLDQNVSTALGDVQTAYNNQTQAIQANITSITSFITSLTNLKQSLSLGALSTLSPQDKYLAEQQLFTTTSAAAASGDATAQGQLPQVAQDFLTASQAYNASSQAYVDDYNAVQKSLDANIATAQAQLSQQQQALDAANQMVTGILNLNTTVQTLASALNAYFASQTAAGQVASGSTGSLGAGLDYSQANGVVDYGTPGGATIQSGGGITNTGLSDDQLAAIGQSVQPALQGNMAVQAALAAAGVDAGSIGMGAYNQMLYAAEDAYGSGSSMADAIAAATAVNGSHAGGLDSVPFDGYKAELHKGEAVVTSANNQKLSQMLSIDWSRFGNSDQSALLSEIKSLRAEVAASRQDAKQIAAVTLQQGQQQHAESRVDASKQTRHLQTAADATQQTANHTGKIARNR